MQTDKLITNGQKWEESGEKLKKYGEKIDKIGNKLSIVSGAIGGIAVASLKSAVDFESAFTGVTKTVDGTEEQLANLKQGILDMSTQLPSSASEIASVAEAAGQLGIQTDNILDFSKAMIDLGNSTNLTSDEAASQLAKFANIMQMSQKDFDKLGSSIVDLGNHFETTEADIVDMSMRLAGAGKQVGLSEGEVLGLATALSSVGIEAEMGGSAISKAMVKMQNAVEQGGTKLNDVLEKTGLTLRELELMSANDSTGFKELSQSIGMTSTEVKQLITAGTNLEDFAKVSGMTTEQFKKAWKEDAAGALSEFIKGLGDAENKGESAITMLSEMGLTEVRLRDSLLRAANAGTLFNDAIATGNKAWKDNTALANEANKRYATTESQMKMLKNEVQKTAIEFGEELAPSLRDIVSNAKPMLESISSAVKAFSELNDEQKQTILKIGAFVVAAGPFVKILGTITKTTGSVVKGIGTVTKAIGLMKNGIGDATGSSANLAKAFNTIKEHKGIAIAATGIVASAGIIISKMKEAEEQTKNSFSAMAQGASDYYSGIQNAESYLNSFNTTLFATAEEQQKLQDNMNEVQEGITAICKKASDERRDYTQEEITQLDEYFTKLRELKDREIEIQMQMSEAITQQAKSNSENFQGSLEEYQVLSQKWIKTAEEQANSTINLIEQGTIEEIALLNQKYSTEESRQSEAYQTELKNINDRKQQKIQLAQEEVAEVTSIYSSEYTQKLQNDTEYLNSTKDLNEKIKTEKQKLKDELIAISEDLLKTEEQKRAAAQDALLKYQLKTGDIWKEYGKNMDEAQAKQLGIWLAMQANTEMQGGEISKETKELINTLIESYDTLPQSARKAMEETMTEMLQEMKNKEPSLFAKASSISNGILNKLKTTFSFSSDSKGHADGLAYVPYNNYPARLHEGERVLTKEQNKQYMADNIENKVASRNIIVQFYPQTMTEAELQRAERYIARKWGATL